MNFTKPSPILAESGDTQNAYLSYTLVDLDDTTPFWKQVKIPVNEYHVTIGVAELLMRVWNDPSIQELYEKELVMPSLEAPLEYVMQNIRRISQKNYEPTNEDVLTARKRTHGVNYFDFVDEGRKFRLVDVGGQRTERRKWLTHFDGVDAVLFVVGLDQYDQVLMEDGRTNR